MYVGEDTALAEVARAEGVDYVAAPEVVTRHAIEEDSLLEAVRGAWRWQGLPLLLRRHPRLRGEFAMGMFWKRSHAWAPLATLGVVKMKRSRLAALLALPYLVHATPKYGEQPRPRLRAAFEVPGRYVVDVAEMVALAWGSIKHRTPFL